MSRTRYGELEARRQDIAKALRIRDLRAKLQKKIEERCTRIAEKRRARQRQHLEEALEAAKARNADLLEKVSAAASRAEDSPDDATEAQLREARKRHFKAAAAGAAKLLLRARSACARSSSNLLRWRPHTVS